MTDPGSLREVVPALESPQASYAGKTRYTQLEYEAILANASIGIAFTRDRRFFLCNPKFAEMFGWGPDELIGQPGEIVYPSHDSYVALAKIATPILTSGGQLDLEWKMSRKDGSTFLCRMIAKALDASQPQQGTVWIVEDITERRRHADEVARLLREQEAILATASIGIVFLKERRIVRCNRRYEEMYGYEPGELNGKSTEILYVDPADNPTQEELDERLTRRPTLRRVERRRRKDGSVLWIRANGRAVDPQDAQKGSVWTVEDITEERRAEEQLQRVLAEQQALLNNVMVGICFTRERRIERCNPRFEQLLGFAPGSAQGVSLREMFFTDQEFERRAAIYAEIDRGETHVRDEWMRRQDGSGFWCRLSGRAVAPGDPAKGHVWLLEDITERKRADEALQRMVREQDAVLQNALIGIIFVKDGRIVRCNRRCEEIFGLAPGELLEQPAGALVQESGWSGETAHFQRVHVRKDGARIWCSVSGRALQPGNPAQGSVWLFEDVTQERAAEERIERALAEQELILDNASVGIAFVRNRHIERCNRFLEEMVGAAPGELIGKRSSVLFAAEEEWRQAVGRAYDNTGPGETHEAEWRFRRRDGSVFRCRTRGRRIDVGEAEQEWIWSYEDVTAEREAEERVQRALAEQELIVRSRTKELREANLKLEAEIAERKQAEERARHLADHDALTGLPNRRLLQDRLTQALALSERNRKQTAVMFVDLDRFKTINDSLGHSVGDALLKEVAQRLVKQLRMGDTICRIGGDEFVIVLPELKRSADAAHVAQKLIEAISLPLLVDERELTVTPSLGIAVFPDDGRDAEVLIRNADAAMYHAKEMGRANYQFFTEQMNLAASRRLALESDLRRALAKDELRVYFQPIVEADSGHIAGHEALVRWEHPARGVVSPAEFIHVAEETGLILKIGDWVLREACRWATRPGADAAIPVSVNLSARQLSDPKLADKVAAALAESGLPARRLELEITESTAMQQTDATLATFTSLKALGVSIAIDDFGTGYSSLSYLRRFPVDKLKIDRVFVSEVPRDDNQSAIVSAIVAMAHALEVQVTAEGVETEAQRHYLRRCGCDYLQGYLLGRPLPGEGSG